MGSRQSSLSENRLQVMDWVQAKEDETNSLFRNVNPYRDRLLLNSQTQELIEQYHIEFVTAEQYENYVTESDWRTKNPQGQCPIQEDPAFAYIYPLKYFTNSSIHEMCSSVYSGLAYFEKVQFRLKEVRHFPIEDQLYMYRITLQGFKLLYEKVGYFDTNEEMIFINKEGKAKVWLNPNLSLNRPFLDRNRELSPNPHLSTQGSQSDMICTLINIVEENSDHEFTPEQIYFSTYLKSKGLLDKLSFSRAIEEFHIYCDMHKFVVPKYMASIVSLYEDKTVNEQIVETRVEDRKSRGAVNRANSGVGTNEFGYKNGSASRITYKSTISDHRADRNQNSNQASQHIPRLAFNHPSPLKQIKESYRQDSKRLSNVSFIQRLGTNTAFSEQPINVVLNNRPNTMSGNPPNFLHSINNMKSSAPQYLNSNAQINRKPGISHNPVVFNAPLNIAAANSKMTFSQNQPFSARRQNVVSSPINPLMNGNSQQNYQSRGVTPNLTRKVSEYALESEGERRNTFGTNADKLLESAKRSQLDPIVQVRMLQRMHHIPQPSKIPHSTVVDKNKHNMESSVKYYSTDATFMLDDEIANDLQRYLGFKAS